MRCREVTDLKKWPAWKVLHQLLPFLFLLFFKKEFIFGCAGSLLLLGLFSSGGKQGLTLGAEHGLLIVVVSLVAAPWLWSAGSVVWHTSLVTPWHVGSSGSGIVTVSPALTGRFFTTEHQGSFYSSTTSSVKIMLANYISLRNLRKNKPKYPHLQILANIC